MSPDGKWALLTAFAAGQENLYVYSLDELAKEHPVAKQLTSTAGSKSGAQFSPDSKDVFYLDDDRIQTISVEKREPKNIAVTAELDVDFEAQKREVFHQAWSYLNDRFFDPKFNGVDWEAVRREYEPRRRRSAHLGRDAPDHQPDDWRVERLALRHLRSRVVESNVFGPPRPSLRPGRVRS